MEISNERLNLGAQKDAELRKGSLLALSQEGQSLLRRFGSVKVVLACEAIGD